MATGYIGRVQAAIGLAHPRTVYLREADLLPHLDGWLARRFDPEQLDDTLHAPGGPVTATAMPRCGRRR